MINGHGCIGKWMVKRKWKWNWTWKAKWKWKEKNKERDVQAKDGIVNEKSKWKNL